MPKYRTGDIIVQELPTMYTDKTTGELDRKEITYKYGKVIEVQTNSIVPIYKIKWVTNTSLDSSNWSRHHNMKAIDLAKNIRLATKAEQVLYGK